MINLIKGIESYLGFYNSIEQCQPLLFFGVFADNKIILKQTADEAVKRGKILMRIIETKNYSKVPSVLPPNVADFVLFISKCCFFKQPAEVKIEQHPLAGVFEKAITKVYDNSNIKKYIVAYLQLKGKFITVFGLVEDGVYEVKITEWNIAFSDAHVDGSIHSILKAVIKK